MSNKSFRILTVGLLTLIFLVLTRGLWYFLISLAIHLGWQFWLVVFAMILVGRAIYKAQHKTIENPN